jgi:NTE family protein
VEKSSYFEKLVGSLSRIASHSYYPGKEDTVEQCLEEVEEIRLSGRITAEQSATLRELLLGEEPFYLLEGAFREQSRSSETAKPTKIAITCQGDGSHAAFSAGVLQGLLEQDGDHGEIAAIGGMSYGSICALLAWDGLLRGDPQRATDQLQGFWQDYSATCLIDTFLNYSAQMASHLRSMVAFPGLSPYLPSLSQDQLRKMLERRVNFAEARSMAGNEDAPGLLVEAVDVHGAIEAFRGPQISADHILASATIHRLFSAVALAGHSQGEGLLLQNPPIRELTDFGPDEIWVIQVIKSTRNELSRRAGDLSDHYELTSSLLLEQELRFIQKINGLLDRGMLIDSGYRHIEVHRIIMEHDLDCSSKLDRSPSFICHMMAYGRERAKQFLDKRKCGLSRRLPTRSMR